MRWTCAAPASAWWRIRRRHMSIAVATWSASRSASDVTGCGALTTTSWAPRAGSAVKSSGRASGAGVGPSGVRAGKRFGTTRTVQPGVSGGPPPGRTASSSGGVRSSWPSRKGSVAGSIGSGGVARGPPPGRVARSPATIARSPVSGSTRTSGTERVAPDVLLEGLLVGIGPGVHEGLLPRAVVEDRGGRAEELVLRLRGALGVLDAGIGQRDPAQLADGPVAVVLVVDAEEGDLLAEGQGGLLDGGELDEARPAPGRPDVDHRRMALDRGQLAVELARGPRQQDVRAAVQRRERGRGARELRAHGGRIEGMRLAAGGALLGLGRLAQPDHEDRDERERGERDGERLAGHVLIV